MDGRLVRALELLQELVHAEGGRTASGIGAASSSRPRSLPIAGGLGEVWPEAADAVSLPNVLASTTDLLVPWSTEETPGESAPDVESTSAPRAAEELARAASSIASASGEPELAEDDAESIVDSLYDFVHALERREVEHAMELVAADFHAMEGDREVDRAVFRQVLERFVEERPGELRISLARVPEPIVHRLGVLLHLVLQVEASEQASAALVESVVVFRQDREEGWKLAGFHRIDP